MQACHEPPPTPCALSCLGPLHRRAVLAAQSHLLRAKKTHGKPRAAALRRAGATLEAVGIEVWTSLWNVFALGQSFGSVRGLLTCAAALAHWCLRVSSDAELLRQGAQGFDVRLLDLNYTPPMAKIRAAARYVGWP